MDSLLAITYILVIFAVGDFISSKTKSIVSMMFVASVLIMVGFWMGVPTTLFVDAQLSGIGALMIGFLITHMGTLLDFGDLKEQWKTVVIAAGAVVGIAIFLFIVGSPIIGKTYAIAAAPPISGGVVAAIIMGEAATAKGLDSLAVFATILVVVQGFFGYPVATFFLNKEAKKILANQDLEDKSIKEVAVEKKVEKKKFMPALPEDLQTTYILLAKLALAVMLSFKLADLTGGIIHKFVMCLLVGVALSEIGFLEKNIMVKANAFGLAMVSLMAVIFASLTQASVEMLLSLLFPLLASLSLGTVGIILFSSVIGKLLGVSMNMAIAIGTSALFGFPGTFILSNEVARSNASNKEEQQLILDAILPKMLVAGFVTVTIASVVLAGFMVKFL
ncbi:MAG: hypothetical protein GX046_06995 [Tissierellia bacterium]|nr:hypothetical protein [Tissierellia bacterium]